MSVQLFLFLCVFVLAGMTKGSWGDSCELNDNCESCELIHNINDRVKCAGNLSALNNAHRKSGRMLDRSPPPHAATLQRPSCYSPSSSATPPPLAYRGSRSHFVLSKVVTMCEYPIGSVCRLRMCLSLAGMFERASTLWIRIWREISFVKSLFVLISSSYVVIVATYLCMNPYRIHPYEPN